MNIKYFTFLFLCFFSCKIQKVTQTPKIITTKIYLKPTIKTYRDGYFDDKETWELKQVPEPFDILEISHTIIVRDKRSASGWNLKNNVKIKCEAGGSLSISPKK
jgi:hypothetical protein